LSHVLTTKTTFLLPRVRRIHLAIRGRRLMDPAVLIWTIPVCSCLVFSVLFRPNLKCLSLKVISLQKIRCILWNFSWMLNHYSRFFLDSHKSLLPGDKGKDCKLLFHSEFGSYTVPYFIFWFMDSDNICCVKRCLDVSAKTFSQILTCFKFEHNFFFLIFLNKPNRCLQFNWQDA